MNTDLVLPAVAIVLVLGGLAAFSEASETSCVSEADCVTFLYQDGKFEFLPTER